MPVCLFRQIHCHARHNAEKPNTTIHDRKEFLEHVRYWCAEVEYFDTLSHTLKQYYSPVKENSNLDGIISFNSNNGSVIDSSQFLNDGRFSIDGDGSIADITIKNGQHFKVTVLAIGKCNNTKLLDSLKKHFTDEPEQPDNSNEEDN
jgi:hypothetical protein